MSAPVINNHAAIRQTADHTSWAKGERVLPRGIYGSDIDCPRLSAFDNFGHLVLVEFERGKSNQWPRVGMAQRGVYEALLNRAPHVAALCSHDAPTERLIDSRSDVTSFQLMAIDGALVSMSGLIEGNDSWQDFVFAWFKTLEAPAQLRRALVEGAYKNGRQRGMSFRRA